MVTGALGPTICNCTQLKSWVWLGVSACACADRGREKLPVKTVKEPPLASPLEEIMLVPRLAAALAAALMLNLHYVLLGRPFLEGPLTSRPVLALGNTVVGKLVRLAMTKEGVPEPDRTEMYSHGEHSGRVDIYEPQSEAAGPPRTAVIYFHSGAFIAGDRSFGAGVCGLLASHGAVCLSASYRLTNSGYGVAGCIEDAWAVLRWTRANAARLHVDPSKIVVVGDSAGGLLATSLGTGLGADVPTGMGGFNQVGR